MSSLINYYQEQGMLIIEILLEKLDLFETPNVLSKVEDALKTSSSSCVIIDLKNVVTIDSSGIGFLIAIRNSLAKQKIPLKVVCASETVLQIFRLTKVSQLIPIFSQKEEAVSSAEIK
ncbi:MAG: STAS domain-containing protein [Spirochaetota bacterium]